MKTKIIPVIVGALGMIKKETQKYVNEIPANLSLDQIQKIVLNSTAHITLSFSFLFFFNTHYVPPKLYFYTNFIRFFLCNFITKFCTYNIYTIQIDHNNSYQNYMRLERNIHKHEQSSTLGHWL